jgi:glucose-6-phosphate isomerase
MLNKSPLWQELIDHRKEIETQPMRTLFARDPGRFTRYSMEMDGLFLDYSKNRITDTTMNLLMDLARVMKVEEWRNRMFDGDKINTTEDRAVLHTALRRPAGDRVMVDGENVMPFVHDVLERMREFVSDVHDGRKRGYTGKKFTHVVNIGIGGSDLGPKLVCEALKPFHEPGLEVRFVSNVDGTHLTETLKDLNPETTLFLVCSKTFTTQETMLNALSAQSWLIAKLKNEGAIGAHFAALSTNDNAVRDFGIAPEHMFPFRDWVGGRYSLWSSVGLSIALAIGFANFEKLLAGACAMDRHFRETPLHKNMPVIMAMLGIWYRNFWGASGHALLPYDQYLESLPRWLQQTDMESNGKSVTRDSQPVEWETAPVIFGEPGTNGQHAFYQMLHQGTELVPCDFIGIVKSHNPLSNTGGDHHKVLMANMTAQSQALMKGRTLEEADNNPHRVFSGNRPSNTIILDKLDPHRLGMLLALYEHRVFVQGIVWQINSFDQFGVELGKELANKVLSGADTGDSSTSGLNARLRA